MFIPFHDDNPTQRTPLLTIGLIAANVAVFLSLRALPPDRQTEMVFTRGFVPARVAQLFTGEPLEIRLSRPQQPPRRFARGPVVEQIVIRLPADRQQILLSLLTTMFMHGGWMHLVGNMWFLWLFGNNVEDRLGHGGFLVLYLLGGLFASGCHWLTGPMSEVPVIGASGAVAAILGAYAITWPWARVHVLVFLVIFITVIHLPALAVLGLWFLMQLLEAVRAIDVEVGGGVAWWAHVGGFVAGVVLMPVFSAFLAPQEHRQSDPWDEDIWPL